MQRSGNQDTDGIVWSTVGLRLGTDGMDLRRPTEPPALADLVNARFLDERTIQRRGGHTGQELRDGSAFPATGDVTPGDWVYGHGQLVTGAAENTTYPIHLRGAATFDVNGAPVVWTGDRLLTPQDTGGHALGESTFWQRVKDVANGDSATKSYQRGVPAFLPLQTDVFAPATVHGDWIESCLTTELRVYCHVVSNTVTATVINRATGLVVNTTIVTGTAVTPVEPSLVDSAGTPTLLFRDTADGRLFIRFWTGEEWTAENTFGHADAYDISATAEGFFIAWRDGATINVGIYTGMTARADSFTFGTPLMLTGTPNGSLALAVAVNGEFGVAYQTGAGVTFDEYDPTATSTYAVAAQAALVGGRGLALTARGLTVVGGFVEWAMYVGNDTDGKVTIQSFSQDAGITTSAFRYNSEVISRAFAVGDEVFCWLKSRNSATGYLLAGATHPVIAGYADREVTITPKIPGSYNYWPARVLLDPADASGVSWTWTRPFNTGGSLTGNVLSGDIDFLPPLSTAIYGRSVYLSGSAVKNHDGVTLFDTGFQDFPTVKSNAPSTVGGDKLTLLGTYEYIIRAVRYNTAGERFESAAVTYTADQLTGSDDTITLTINTLPSISGPATSPDTNDVVLEVYRTETTGTTFYLEGTVANSLTAATVSFVSSMPDTTLIDQKADPHATGVGIPAEIESFGPIGCAALASVGDRLWGAGGQVPVGTAQFSKLKNVGFGVGFDDLAGYIQVDNEGGAITSLAGQHNAVVIFERHRGYVYDNTGPDNFGNGGFNTPSVVLSTGAKTHFGTGLCQMGVVFWGDDGPLLLAQNFTVMNIGIPVRPFSESLSPTGIRINTAKMEVVWHCGTDALLWNFESDSRWARWVAADVVGTSDIALVTSDGRLLTESTDAYGDDGVPFEFRWRTGDVRPEQLREGHTLIRRAGVSGFHEGDHTLRLRVYFDGSPGWSEESIWAPTTDTWLVTGDDLSTLTPLAIDSLNPVDKSGAYGTHKRLRRLECSYFSIEVTDLSSLRPTMTPLEMAFEMGAKPGLARVPASTFTGQDRG